MTELSAAERMYPSAPAAPEPRQESQEAISAPEATTPAARMYPAASDSRSAAGGHSEPERSSGDAAARMFEDDPDPSVAWGEPPVPAAAISLTIGEQEQGWDRTAAGDAARQKVAEALSHAGAGSSVAGALWKDVVAANRPDYRAPAPDAAVAELRRAWGSRTDEKIAAAQALVQKAAEKDPSILRYLEETGLGNSLSFIRKLAARAARRR